MFALNANGENAQAAETGLEYLDRLANPLPPGAKKALGDAVVQATSGRNIEGRAIDSLKRLGYKVNRKGGFLSRRHEVDTGSPDTE
jgi:hypothetical protein